MGIMGTRGCDKMSLDIVRLNTLLLGMRYRPLARVKHDLANPDSTGVTLTANLTLKR